MVDLIHDYYLSQIAILLDREMVSGNDVVDSYLIIKRVLPQLGYELERKNTTVWGEDDFERALSNAVAETNAWIGGSCDVAVTRKIRRKFRIQSAEISEDKAYNLIVTELCLLKAGSGRRFPGRDSKGNQCGQRKPDCSGSLLFFLLSG